MIKKLIVACVFMCMLQVATAVTQCVKLASNIDDYLYGTSVNSKIDWEISETDGTIIHGIGVCSNQTGNFSDVSVTLSVGMTNENCWCRMISPTVSSWVFLGNLASSYGGCSYMCGTSCAWYMGADNSLGYSLSNINTFRSAMFGSFAQ